MLRKIQPQNRSPQGSVSEPKEVARNPRAGTQLSALQRMAETSPATTNSADMQSRADQRQGGESDQPHTRTAADARESVNSDAMGGENVVQAKMGFEFESADNKPLGRPSRHLAATTDGGVRAEADTHH